MSNRNEFSSKEYNKITKEITKQFVILSKKKLYIYTGLEKLIELTNTEYNEHLILIRDGLTKGIHNEMMYAQIRELELRLIHNNITTISMEVHNKDKFEVTLSSSKLVFEPPHILEKKRIQKEYEKERAKGLVSNNPPWGNPPMYDTTYGSSLSNMFSDNNSEASFIGDTLMNTCEMAANMIINATFFSQSFSMILNNFYNNKQ